MDAEIREFLELRRTGECVACRWALDGRFPQRGWRGDPKPSGGLEGLSVRLLGPQLLPLGGEVSGPLLS